MTSNQEQSPDETDTDQYDAVLRAAEQGLRLSINNESRSQPGTGEFQVLRSRVDETAVDIQRPIDQNEQYRIHRDERGELVYSRLTDDGLRYQDDVTTIEIIGC